MTVELCDENLCDCIREFSGHTHSFIVSTSHGRRDNAADLLGVRLGSLGDLRLRQTPEDIHEKTGHFRFSLSK
ncbi:hypothetical protein EYF80_053925 [Liparis tanakae]|uniref:Uncharacterized protein n=1 Tax=Liparis tanakae TaxID=230148 RepID=A0A4Z2F476_9TELE|nr:hypothetical protein EYF80_053925 [Liparis tanakae]